MTQYFDVDACAEQYADDWTNGNRKDVVSSLKTCTPVQAAAVALALYQKLAEERQVGPYSLKHFVSRLLLEVENECEEQS